MKTEIEKPKAKVLGQDGNVFNLIAICSTSLKRAGQNEQAEQMRKRVFASNSYDEALCIMSDYCEFC